MITTKIKIKQHLAEFMYGRYNNGDFNSPINISTREDLYHLMWNLMKKRPSDASPVDDGNLCLLLNPNHPGKNPGTYNYLDEISANIIQQKIEALFYLELHTRVEVNRMKGFPYTTIQVISLFMREYCIESISEDALIKNEYRHREKICRREKKRKYSKS